jgi:N-acetylglucosaminyl-diphospho-decaprenol L-rhamnosyltransferase
MKADGSMSVVVVSYNTRALTIRCLETLCDNLPDDADVCVVDNGSSDGSCEELAEFAREKSGSVHLVANGRNLGFGPANNLGVMRTGADFIALVNSDAFVDPGALEGLRDYLRRTPKAAVAGPMLKNPDGSFQESRFDFPSPARAWAENLGVSRVLRFFKRNRPHVSGAVAWLSGACLMVRSEVWNAVGGFDERFFLYAEETDLQRRIAECGWEIHWAPDFTVTHIGGGSGVAEKEVVRERFFDGADRYILRYHGVAGLWVFRAATCCGAALRWTLYVLKSGWTGKGARRWAWIFRRQISSPLPSEWQRMGAQEAHVFPACMASSEKPPPA